jgi:hypothetical protein
MAITKNLTTTISLVTDTGTIVDSSVYSSPTRVTCGVYVKAYKTEYDGNKLALATVGNTADPNTDSSWTFPYNSDGWYKIAYMAIPDYVTPGTPYNLYDAVFDPAAKVVYRSKIAANSSALNVTASWEVISDPAALAFNVGAANESLNISNVAVTGVTVLNSVLTPIITEAFGTQAGKAFLEASSDYKRSQDVRTHELLSLALKAIAVADARQNYSEGEIFARRATAIISAL